MSWFDSDYTPSNPYFIMAACILLGIVALVHVILARGKRAVTQAEPLVPSGIYPIEDIPTRKMPALKKEINSMIEKIFPKRVFYPWMMKHCTKCQEHYWTHLFRCPMCGEALELEMVVTSQYPFTARISVIQAGKSFDGLKGELEDELQYQLTIEEVGDILTAECTFDAVYERAEAKAWLEMRRKFLAGTWHEYHLEAQS